MADCSEQFKNKTCGQQAKFSQVHWQTYACSDDGKWKVVVVEYVGHKQEVHVASMSR